MKDLNQQVESLRERQAATWVAALGHADRQQRAAFIEWLKESPLNVREYLYASAIDKGLENLDSRRSQDIEALLKVADRTESRIGHLNDFRLPSFALSTAPPVRGRRWGYALAASLLAVMCAGWWQLSAHGWQEFRTGVGEQRAIQLEDGSVVYLNASSQVAVRLSNTVREVKLVDGEALFKVHHDSLRPFSVFARDAVIRDVGTQFNVYSRSDGMKIAVLEGSVEVTAEPSARPAGSRGHSGPVAKRILNRTLVAHEQAKLDDVGNVVVSELPDLSVPIAWQQRRLVFRNEPLSHIIAEFNRHNHHPIRVEGSELMNHSYTGSFDADDLESLLLVLANDPDISIDQSSDEIVLHSHADDLRRH